MCSRGSLGVIQLLSNKLIQPHTPCVCGWDRAASQEKMKPDTNWLSHSTHALTLVQLLRDSITSTFSSVFLWLSFLPQTVCLTFTDDCRSSPKLSWCTQNSDDVLNVSKIINYSCNFSIVWLCFVLGSGTVCWKPSMFPLMNVNDEIILHTQAPLMSADVTDHVLEACLSPQGSFAACFEISW